METSRTRPPKRRYSECPKSHIRAYSSLWDVVDGSVYDALFCHPDYVRQGRRMAAQRSITKRVVGAVLAFATQSFAAQAAKGRRLPSPDQAPSAVTGGAPEPVSRAGGREGSNHPGWLAGQAASRYSMRSAW